MSINFLLRHLLYFLLFVPFLGFPQKNIIHYTTANGLPHDITFGICQDSKGYIWIGTDNGLAKFDGHDFKVFTIDEGLRTNYVIDIAEDSSGQKILATWGGGIHTVVRDSVTIPKIENDSLSKINNLVLWKDNIIVKSSRGNHYYKKTTEGYERSTLIVKTDLQGRLFLGASEMHLRPNGTLGVINDELIVYNGNSLNNRNTKYLYGLYGVDKDWNLKKVFPFLDNSVIQSIKAIGDGEYVASQVDTFFFLMRINFMPNNG